MKKTKEKFMERPLSHADKKELAYWINQGIDLNQLNHITGKEVSKWK